MEKVRHRPEQIMRACSPWVWYSVKQMGQLSVAVSISIVVVLAVIVIVLEIMNVVFIFMLCSLFDF